MRGSPGEMSDSGGESERSHWSGLSESELGLENKQIKGLLGVEGLACFRQVDDLALYVQERTIFTKKSQLPNTPPPTPPPPAPTKDVSTEAVLKVWFPEPQYQQDLGTC